MIKSNATKNVIIIDDDINILDSFKFIFRNISTDDIVINYFNDSLLAFDNMLKNNYDTIITDIEMPKMSGVDMILELQKIKKLNKIIFISSNIKKYEDIINGLNGLFMSKPIKKYDLLKLI